MPFCANCGARVENPYCTRCGVKTTAGPNHETSPTPTTPSGMATTLAAPALADAATASTVHTSPESVPVSRAPDGFFRTPLQVAILGYATFGLYSFYWLIRGRRLAEKCLGESITSYWWYLFWIIPIVGLVSGIKCAGMVQDRVVAAGIGRPAVSLGVQTFFLFIIGAFWRLPDPYWLISIIVPVCLLGGMHVALARAERADYPAFRWPRLGVWEWILVIVGGCFWVLMLLGFETGPFSSAQQWALWLMVVAVIMSLLMFAILSRETHSATEPTRAGTPLR